MATTQDIAELKAQFDERIGQLRESFGVVEGDVTKLGSFSHEFTFTSLEEHQRDKRKEPQEPVERSGFEGIERCRY